MQKTRLSLGVALLASLFAAQLGWWGLHIWHEGDALDTARQAELRWQRRLAQATWESHPLYAGEPEVAWAALAASFPGVVHQPTTGMLAVDAAELELLQARRGGRRAMVLGEGAVFLLLAAAGLWLLHRTARREAFLALQHSNFLHAVTHEFRSPLQGLRLASESLQKRAREDFAKEHATGMLEDLARLEGLVENLLAVGRFDAEAFNLEPVPLDLSAAVARVLADWRAGPAAQGAPLEQVIEPGVRVEADAASLEHIVRNLLENAHKYGNRESVRLELRTESSWAVLEVRDHGRGFTAEEHKHLFERFWRAGDERVRSAPGAGLGLYLVAELARAQGARVQAESAGPGRGAAFRVLWPLTAGGGI
ncbi:MAG TPA: HAMP domain-containing sensor histidine kinase [Planctomycetota bacterium]